MALSGVVILFSNRTIFLIPYSLAVSTNASGRDGWLLEASALSFLDIPPIIILFSLIVVILVIPAVD